jgi:uncharacterized protein (DUF433 family)
MALEVKYPHITKAPGQPACLERTPRVRVAQIAMDYLFHGWSIEEMCHQHPDLTIAEAHAAMLYYWDHKDEIEREIEAEWEQVQKDRLDAAPSPFLTRLRSQGIR